MSEDSSVHLGTGKMVEKKDIPSYKGKPPGDGPFERTACGVYASPKHVGHTKKGVTCGSCRRTHLYRYGEK